MTQLRQFWLVIIIVLLSASLGHILATEFHETMKKEVEGKWGEHALPWAQTAFLIWGTIVFTFAAWFQYQAREKMVLVTVAIVIGLHLVGLSVHDLLSPLSQRMAAVSWVIKAAYSVLLALLVIFQAYLNREHVPRTVPPRSRFFQRHKWAGQMIILLLLAPVLFVGFQKRANSLPHTVPHPQHP